MEKMECYHQLANAIVLQAVKDYQEALRKYYKGDRSYEVVHEKKHLEDWFHSDQFAIFTDLDPDTLIRRLKKEAYRK